MGNEGFNLRVHCGVGRCRGVRYQRMRRPVAAGCQARANDIEHTDHGANDIEDTDHGANDIEHTDGGVPVSCWRVCAIRTTGWLLHHAPPERGDQPGVLPGWQFPADEAARPTASRTTRVSRQLRARAIRVPRAISRSQSRLRPASLAAQRLSAAWPTTAMAWWTASVARPTSTSRLEPPLRPQRDRTMTRTRANPEHRRPVDSPLGNSSRSTRLTRVPRSAPQIRTRRPVCRPPVPRTDRPKSVSPTGFARAGCAWLDKGDKAGRGGAWRAWRDVDGTARFGRAR